MLQGALIRGQFERGEVGRITGLPERSAPQGAERCFASGFACVGNTERSCFAAFSRRRARRSIPPPLPPNVVTTANRVTGFAHAAGRSCSTAPLLYSSGIAETNSVCRGEKPPAIALNLSTTRCGGQLSHFPPLSDGPILVWGHRIDQECLPCCRTNQELFKMGVRKMASERIRRQRYIWSHASRSPATERLVEWEGAGQRACVMLRCRGVS